MASPRTIPGTETLALSFKDAEAFAPTAKNGLKGTPAGEVLQVGLARTEPSAPAEIGARVTAALFVDSPLNRNARSRSS
jgi:hypothetical protein